MLKGASIQRIDIGGGVTLAYAEHGHRDNVAEWRELAISPATHPKLDYDRVKDLQVPTLILSGGKNAGGFNDLIDAHLQHLIRGAERVTILDASHEMFLDAPLPIAEAMLRHFARPRTSGESPR